MRHLKMEMGLRLARTLAGTAEGLTLDEMAIELGVSRRTAERIRDALAAVVDVDEVFDGRRKRFRVAGGLDTFMHAPTAAELVALDAGSAALRSLGSADTANALVRLGDKLSAALPMRVRRRLSPDHAALRSTQTIASRSGPRPRLDPSLIPAVQHAIMAGTSLHFKYIAQDDDDATPRHVHPWGLLYGGLGYVVGPVSGSDRPLLWRLDRISAVVEGRSCRPPPSEFDLPRWAASAVGVYREPSQDVILRFSADVAGDIHAYQFHADQTVSTLPDGAVQVSFTAGGMLELAHDLFAWAATVEIMSPPALRTMLTDLLEESLAHHRRTPRDKLAEPLTDAEGSGPARARG